MKKVLLATTVLAMTATVAAAEVKLSGNARMGLIYNGNTVTTGSDSKLKLTSRVRIIFTASGESDSGLSFGATVRNDQSGQGNTANGDSKVFISGAFGKLTFGDNDTAANVLVGHVDQISLTGLGDNNELGYLGMAKTSALYEYSTGALSFAASVGQFGIAVPGSATQSQDAAAIAVKYTMDGYAVALGYETNRLNTAGSTGTAATVLNDNQLSLGLSGTFGQFGVKAVIADRKSWGTTQYALSGTYTMDALKVTAFYANKDTKAAGVTTKSNAYGLGASYNLGGGATVVGGMQKVKGLKAVADVGVSLSF